MTKRTKRVLFVVAWIAAIVATGTGVYALRQHQIDRDAVAAGAAGRAALARGDHRGALAGLGEYLGRYGDSGATAGDYVLLARARRRVELPNAKHLDNAIRALLRALDLDPACAEAKSDLLDLYVESRKTTEALGLIEQMIGTSPGDLRLLRTKCDLLESLRQFGPALEVARRINVSAPDDFDGLFRRLRLLVATQAPAAEVDAWIDSVVKSHAGDARFELVRAAALTRRNETARARECLDRVLAAGPASKDGQFAGFLVRELDSAGRFDDSLRALEQVDDGSDLELGRELVRRLAYVGRLPEVAARLERRGRDRILAEPEVLALHTLSLRAAGRAADAEPFARELAARGDAAGIAWSVLLENSASVRPEGGGASVAALAKAVAAVPDSALLRLALGDAHAAAGETDMALEAWTAAAARAPAWALPLRQIAETLIRTRREYLAPAVARAALVRAPGDLAAVTTYLRATAAVAGDLDQPQIDALLAAAEALRAESPERADELLPELVGLVARLDKAEAERRLWAVLAGRTQSSEATLLRLAAVADRAGIPLAARLLDLSESIHGATPRWALAAALARAKSAGAEAGLKVLDEARARAADGAADLNWELSRSSYLDAVGSADAGPAWISLADGRPDVLLVQLGALSSPGVWRDRDAVQRAIERVRRLTGDEAVTWRIARARWILTAPSAREADIAEAAKILNDVTRVAAKSTAPRVLLAQALERLGNLSGAEDQLRVAAELSHGDVWIALEIARLAHQAGRAEAARRQLDRVLGRNDLAPEQIARAARQLAALGDLRRGVEILEPLTSAPESRGDGMVLLAKLFAKLGEVERAIALTERLMAVTPDLEAAQLAADLYAAAGRSADADAALSRLSAMELRPGERELARARHAAVWGPAGAARDWYRKAVAAAPDRADAWTSYLSWAVMTGEAESVRAILDHPRAQSVEPVTFVAANRALCLAVLADERLRAMLMAALADTADRRVLLDAIRATSEGWADPETRAETARAVQLLAEASPRVLPLQLLAAQLAADVGDLRRGSAIAHRAMTEFPSSATLARQAAELFARCGRWGEALAAGLAWRDRSSRQDPRPELFVADALVRTGRAADAAAALAPRIPAALAHPNANEDLILTYAAALVRSGESARATEIVADLAGRSSRWQALMLGIDPERLGSAAAASAWIEAGAGVVPAGDVAGRVRLARAWGLAWEKFDAPEFLAKAKALLAGVTSAPNAPAQAFFVSGTLAQQAGDLDGGERDYQAALQRDPDLLAARNNLAVILADTGRWKEAVEEATKVTRAAPESAECLDTLAHAFRNGREFDKARTSLLDAIRLEPGNPEWRVSLAETLAQSGNRDEAGRIVARIDEMTFRGADLPAHVRERLDKLRLSLR